MRREKGHTLIEIVMAIVVLSLLAGVVGMAVSHGSRASVASFTRTETLGKLRYAVERVAREVRMVRRDPAAPTNYDIITRNATTFAFRRLANDGVTVTTVTLNIAGPVMTLAYNTPAGTPTLVNQISSAAFTYLQADGVSTATSNTDVAFVQLDLTLADASGNTYSERVRVGLRNRE